MRLRHVLSAMFALSLGVAAHADTFSYTLNGGASGFSGTGTLTGTQIGTSGTYLITGISGTGVTGLINPGGFNGNNNIFYPGSNAPGGTVFDRSGLGFIDQNSTGVYQVDLYGSGGSYYAFVTNTGTSSTVPVQFSATPVAVTPEPSSLALLGTGVLGVFGVARRRFAATR